MKESQNRTSTEDKSKNDEITERKPFLPAQVEEFLTFERSCHHLTSAYIEILSFSFVIHTFFGYLLLANHPLSPYLTETILFFRTQVAPYRFFQGCTYILSILLLVSLFGAKLKYKTRIWFSAIKKIISFFGILCKISTFLTSLLLYINLWENVPGMILIIGLFIFMSLFTENYSRRREENYQSSHRLSLIFKIGIIIQTSINCLIVHLGNLTTFCAFAALFGLLTLIWHAKGGYALFVHSTSRKIQLLFCGAIISSSLLFLLLIKPRQQKAVFNFVEWIVSMVVVTFYLNQYQKKKRFTFVCPSALIEQEGSVGQYQLNVSILLEESDQCVHKQNLLVGILSFSIQKCPSPTCYLKQKIVFDPIIKREFQPKNAFREKDSVFRFFLKCIYDRALNHKKTKERMIDYVQFCISQMGDFSKHCFILSQLEHLPNLSFLQKIKIHKLKTTLKEQSESFNKLIFGGKVEFDEVLASQHTFDLILRDIHEYCRRNVEIWQKNTQKQIDVFALKQEMSENFKLIPSLNQKWNHISKFLSIQKIWRYVYLNYALFIKNQNIKIKEAEPHPLAQDTQTQTALLNPNAFTESYISDSLCFDKRATIVMCILEDKMKVYKVSQNFEKLIGYSEHQIKGGPLTMILPYEIRSYHDKKVVNWLERGQTTDDNYYSVKHTHYVNKFQQNVQSIVFFKLYTDITSENHILRFAALIKVIQAEPSLRKNSSLMSNNNKEHSSSAINILQRNMMERGGGRLSLKAENNIFIKDENLSPTKTIIEINKVKVVMRLLTIVLMGLLLSVVLSIKSDLKQVDDHARAELLFSHLFNYPMNLAKFYYSILTSGDELESFYQMKIESVYKKLKLDINSTLTPRTLFSRKLNQPKYYPPYIINEVNQGLNYTNSDLFYLMVSSLTTLSQNNFTNTSHDFIMLNSYMKPSFSEMMNATKNNLHLQMQAYLHTFQNNQIIFIGAFSFILIVAALYLSYQIFKYFSNMREAIDIIVQFKDEDVSFIIKYWRALEKHFSNMNKSNIKFDEVQQQNSQNQIDPVEEVEEQNEEESSQSQKGQKKQASLNQKHKLLLFSSKQQRKVYKICLMMLLLLFLFIPIVIVVQTVNLKKIDNLIQFQSGGYFISKYFPITTIAAYGLSNKFFFQSYPQSEPYSASRYEDVLSTLEIMMNFTYLPQLSVQSSFYQKEQKYFFGNACLNNQEILQKYCYSQETCSTIVDSTFTHGITSYIRSVYPDLKSYLKNETYNIGLSQFNQFASGLGLSGYLIQDLLETWLKEFSSLLSSFESQSWTLSLTCCFVLLFLHVFIFQILVLSTLREDYSFMKMVFSSCVPEHILTKEKVIKHRFYQSGILTVT